jgi:hypothetical protein
MVTKWAVHRCIIILLVPQISLELDLSNFDWQITASQRKLQLIDNFQLIGY